MCSSRSAGSFVRSMHVVGTQRMTKPGGPSEGPHNACLNKVTTLGWRGAVSRATSSAEAKKTSRTR